MDETNSLNLYSPATPTHDEPGRRTTVINHWSFRYLILFLVCILKCVLNYVWQIPSGMENIITQVLDVDVTRYNLLFSVFAWPNIILPLIEGVLVDRIIGIRMGLLLPMFICLMGQLVFSFGGYYDSFILMIISRFVSGIGSDMALVVSDAFAARWFRGKEIALMFALLGISCRFGGIGGIYLSTCFYDWLGFINNKHSRLGLTLMTSFGILLIATCTTVLLVILDKKGEKVLMKQNKEINNKPSNTHKDCCRNFGVQFWLVVMMYTSFKTTMFTFITVSQLFYISKFHLSAGMANIVTIVTYSMTLIGPVIGIIIDKTGYYVSWALFCGFGLIFGSHLFFGLSTDDYYIPFIGNTIIGISYAFFNTAIRSLPPILVSNNQLVTAYGCMMAVQSIGSSVAGIVIGVIIDNYGYLVQEVFLLYVCLLGIVPGIVLVFFMRSKGNEGKH